MLGRSPMQDNQVRLECLKLAIERQGAKDDRPVLEIATEYYQWISNPHADKSKDPAAGRKPSGRSGL